MIDVLNFAYVNSLFTCLVLIFLITKTKADDDNINSEIKPMITNGYRMFSSIYTQHVVSIRVLREIKYPGDNHLCGGAIISPRRILTAAHCVLTTDFGLIPAKTITIYAGSPMRVTPTGEEKIFDVSRAIVHPDYTTSPVYADIAYLILIEAIQEVEDVIKIIPLAQKTPTTGALCTAIGWGRIFERGPMPDEILHVNLYIWDEKQCRKIHRNMREGIFCAGDLEDRGKGTCHGDSGGPLFCDGKLAGIVSYGVGCGWSEVAADFYTDVAYFLSWLNYGVKVRENANVLFISIVANFWKNSFILWW